MVNNINQTNLILVIKHPLSQLLNIMSKNFVGHKCFRGEFYKNRSTVAVPPKSIIALQQTIT